MGPQDFEAAAAARGLSLEVQELAASTRTAREAAEAVGCEERQIVKSLVFLTDGEPVLVLMRGDRRVDLARLAQALGAGAATRADADRVYVETGFAIGGIPPFGHRSPLPTVLDACLLEEPLLFAAAGGPNALFRTSAAQLRDAAQAKVACVCSR